MRKIALLAVLLLGVAFPASAQFSRINTVTLQNSGGTQAAIYASPFTLKVGAACTWSVSGTVATFNCPSSATSPGGSPTQLQFNNTTFAGVSGSAVTAGTGAIVLTAQAATTTPFKIANAASQTATLLDITNAGTVAPTGLVEIRGTGTGNIGGAPVLLHLSTEDDAGWTWLMTSKAAPAGTFLATYISANGGSFISDANSQIVFQTASVGGHPAQSITIFPSAEYSMNGHTTPYTSGNFDLGTSTFKWRDLNLSRAATAATYNTATNCADSAGAAACGAAAAGAVVIDAGASTVVVSTTAVTANSEIFAQYDSSLGTRLGITCNATVALPVITARTAGASFTITVPVAPAVNPACYDYWIVN